MKRLLAIGILLAAVNIAGCAQITLVNDREKVSVGSDYSVTPDIRWNKVPFPNQTDFWTVDGPGLQRILFVSGLEDGKPLWTIRSGNKTATDAPVFKKGMTALEISDVVQATLERIQAKQLKVVNLVPLALNGVNGFRMELTFQTEEGVDMKAFAVGAVRKERLSLVIYWGTAVYFYDARLPNAEQIIRSLEWKA